MSGPSGKIVVKDGKVIFIYEETVAKMFESLGFKFDNCQRVSNVEPEGNVWYADMKPVNGPKLGPFDTRKEALDAEVAWVNGKLADILTLQQERAKPTVE